MNRAAVFFGLLAALLHAVGFVTYQRQAKAGTSDPNLTTWLVSLIMVALNAGSIIVMTDFVSGLQAVVGSSGCVLVFASSATRRLFKKPNALDWVIMVLAFAAVTAWWYYRSASWANAIAITGMVLALLPTWKAAYEDPNKDRPTPWCYWAAAYAAQFVNFALSGQLTWATTWNAAASGPAHLVVAWLSRPSRRAR